MDLSLPKREKPEPQLDRVTKCIRNANGLPIGKAGDNPILDTRMYEVEYADGENSDFSANLIAENMFTQIDKEGNRHVFMDNITDHWFDEAAVKSQDAFVTTCYGTKCRSQKTKGVSIFIKCCDGNITWVALKDLKDYYPVQLAEYAVVAKIYM